MFKNRFFQILFSIVLPLHRRLFMPFPLPLPMLRPAGLS